MADDRHMREFWNARARENPWFFVDDRLDYGDPDLERFWRSGEETLDAVLGLVGAEIGPDDAVVDIGCGVGRITRAIAARARKVTGIDVASEMLELARQHNAELDNVEWVQGDGVSLRPLADSSADAIVSHVVFQHIPDPNVTLGYVAEMGRILKPGGWSAFQISNDPAIHRPRRGLRRRVAALAGRGPRGQEDPAWLGSAVDLDELRETARSAEMTVERVQNPGSQFCIVLLRRSSAA